MQSSPESLKVGQRVHSLNDPRRIGTIKYIGPLDGYPGTWVGVDWDNGDGKHDGTINGTRYFQARSQLSGSFVRPQNLSSGISLLRALHVRYKTESTKEEEEEMYVFSASNKRVSVELLGKEKIQEKLSKFEELTAVSLSYLGVSDPGSSTDINNVVPNLKQLDLTGNLLSEWKDVGTICEQLPALQALNLSTNLLSHDVTGLPQLKSIRILALNNTGITWTQIEVLKPLLPMLEELHLMGNGISEIKTISSLVVHGFDSLRLLNLEDNCISEWNEILKLSFLRSLEQLQLNKNNLNHIFYPEGDMILKLGGGCESHANSCAPFQNLRCLLLGGNNIQDLASIDSLNSFPKLIAVLERSVILARYKVACLSRDIRLSENPIADPGRGGVSRFVLVARLANVHILNGSEVRSRERKESEIRYVRLVMSKFQDSPDKISQFHPRFAELKAIHGIEDERPAVGAVGPQKIKSTAINLKCVAASIGEKPPLTKKLPAATTVGKLKMLCESFFKFKSIKPKLFLHEENSPMPILLDDEMTTLMDIGVGNDSMILVDEES